MQKDFSPIATGSYLEGLAIDGDVLWYSDVVAGGLYRWTPQGVTAWRQGQKWIGGIMLNADGKVLTSCLGGIGWLDPLSGATGMLIEEANGRPIPGVSEMTADAAGGIVFGTVDTAAFENSTPPGPSSIYRLYPDGQVAELWGGLKFCNGLAFSADGRQLYHNETFVGTFAYDVDAQGMLSAPRQLLGRLDCDGLKVDVEGRIWVTGFQSNEITILNPDGTLSGHFAFPASAASNLCFAGDDGRDLYITGVTAVSVGDPSEISIPPELNSTLYHVHAPVAGLPLQRPHFRIE